MGNLSVCMIVKNEEKFLEYCLQSVKDISDEIIVLDTGSTDRTVEIASKYAKVFHTTWHNDFSKAMNESISYATKDWVLAIDGDEFLEKISSVELLNFLQHIDKNSPVNVYDFEIINPDPKKEFTEFFYRDALFKNHQNIKFINPIHPYLDGPNVIRQNIGFKIVNNKNYRTQENKDQKLVLYTNIINEAIEKADNDYTKAHYIKHMVWDFDEFEQYDKALEAAYRLYDLYNKIGYPKIVGDYTNLLYKMSEYEYKKGNYQISLKHADEGLLIHNSLELIVYKSLNLFKLTKSKESRDMLFFSINELIRYPQLKHLLNKVYNVFYDD